MRRPWSVIPLLVALGVTSARADWKDDVGFTRLNQTFTSAVPTKLTAGVTQVEAGYTTAGYYLPDSADPQFTGKAFTDKSTTMVAGASWHATNVGYFLYGSTSSLTPATSAIDIFNVNNWVNSIPLTESRRVENHSWIADGLTSTQVSSVDARLDYMVQTSGFVCVVGVNNGSTSSTTLPQLLCQSYNILSVGLSNGNHTAGFTAYDGTGRIKPEIVAPDPNYTSFATPKVSSAAGLLTEKVTGSPYSLAGANIPLATKALLMAGATKEEFPSWARTTTRPLDLRYGAGELNVMLAYQTLLSSSNVASSNASLAPQTAWSVATASGTHNYFFEIAAGSSNPRFSAALVWHRPVNKSGNGALATYSAGTLSNLDLKLYSVSAGTFTLGALTDSSVSTVDNIEHIYQPNLPPGRYALQVNATSGSAAYALAWRASPTVNVTATAPEARGADGTQGQFTLTRTGPTTTPLYVPISIGGTAVSGTNYTTLPSAVLIPAGSANATIQVVPVGSPPLQGDRTLTLSLATDFTLSAGASANTTVTIRDTTPPTLSLSSNATSLKAGQTASLSFTLSEPSSTFTSSSITVSGGTLSAFSGSGTSYSAIFTPASNSIASGLVSVPNASFSDSAGNTNSDGSDPDNSVSFTIDTLRPTVALSSNATSLKAGQTASLSFTLSEPSSTFASSSITLSGGTLSAFSGSGTSYSAIFTPASNSIASGLVSVPNASFSDSAGNTNSDGSDPDNSVSFVVDTRLYEAWLTARFNSAQLVDPAISGPSADPDADGIPNLLEYAFAREPLTADSPAALPAVVIGLDGRLTLTFFQAASRPDLVFTSEWTSDLTGTWQSSATYLTEISRTATAGGEYVSVRAEATLTAAPAQFLRLRVTRP